MSKNYEYDFTVFLGRVAPFHAGHEAIVKEAMQRSKKLVMVLGSHEKPRTSRDPLTTSEKVEIIRAALPKEVFERIIFAPVHDYTYNNDRWIGAVTSAVNSAIHRDEFLAGPYTVSLIGHNKDHTSFYLNLFPQWDSIPVKNFMNLSATEIREMMYEGRIDYTRGHFINNNHTQKIIEIFRRPELQAAKEEYHFVKEYKKKWGAAPFAPTFNTVDAVVVQSGHILLIERGHNPGKGLLALPGGFVNQYEKLEDACLRELREETKLKVPEPVLRGSIMKSQVFDDPYRSARGRTISMGFLIKLRDDKVLPKVKGSDDAKKAMWVPVADFWKMRSNVFEDHYCIVTELLGI